MKVKLFRVFCICAGVLAFALSNIQAQVVESVSYTPAKTGKYKDIATKSLTTFAGDLSAGEIVGRGEILTADLSSNSISVVSPAKLEAGQNLYLYLPADSNSKISSVSVGPEGNLYTTANATIDYMVAGQEISGNSVNFSKVNAVLGTNGKINLNGVEMANPDCAIKWVKMKAFTTSQTPATLDSNVESYWFAYCDYNPCTDPNLPYYCNGVCKACPCGQVNIGTNSTICRYLTADFQQNLTLIATCNAGWNGHGETGTGEPSAGLCKYTDSNAYSGKFKCSGQVIKKCNSSFATVNTNTFKEQYASTCTSRKTNGELAFTGYIPSSNSCPGMVIQYIAEQATLYNETTSGDHVVSINDIEGPAWCPGVNGLWGQASAQNILDRNIGLRKMFCGFQATDDASANAQIAQILNSTISYSCTGTEYSTASNSLHFCKDLYSGFPTNSTDAQEMCLSIKSHNSTIGDSFSCFLEEPSYQAFRVRPCTTDSETYTKCSATSTCSGKLSSYTSCSSETTDTRSVVKKVRPWCSDNGKDCEQYLTSCNSTSLQSGRTSSTTIYVPQQITGDMLSCTFTTTN